MKSTHDRILNILEDTTGFQDLEGLDSLDQVDVLCALEEEFDIELEELPVSIEGLVKLVDSKL